MTDNAAILRELARVKAVFQLRTIEMVIHGQPTGFVHIPDAARRALAGRPQLPNAEA